jgi:DNA-binding transcriptional ArsR family regulator
MTNLRKVRYGLSSVASIGKALDHPLRVRALAALKNRELCVCELIQLFGLAASTVSKHMKVVADAGLVDRRRDGKWTYYSLPKNPDPAIDHALALVMSMVDDDPVVAKDRKQISTLDCTSEV